MAKRERLFTNRSVTIEINDVALEYLEDLGKTGLYGNTYEQAAEIVFRVGLKHLIDSEVLKVKDRPLQKEESGS
jgi:hypothetical protein